MAQTRGTTPTHTQKGSAYRSHVELSESVTRKLTSRASLSLCNSLLFQHPRPALEPTTRPARFSRQQPRPHYPSCVAHARRVLRNLALITSGGGGLTPLLRRNALLQQSLHGEAVPGILRRTLAWGERAMVLESTFEAGAQLQAHSHPHEQTTYVVSGELEIRLGGGVYILCPGDSLFVPGGVRHAVPAQVHSAQPGQHLYIISRWPSRSCWLGQWDIVTAVG